MNTVKFKRNWIWKIERFFYSHAEEAEDTCTLRWRLMKVVMSIPFSFMTWIYIRLINKWLDLDDSDSGKTAFIIKAVVIGVTIVIGIGALYEGDMTTNEFLNGMLGFLLFGTLLIIVPVLIIWFFLYGIFKFFEWIFKQIPRRKITMGFSNQDVKTDSMFSTLYKSLKEKYCNKIEWTDENNS